MNNLQIICIMNMQKKIEKDQFFIYKKKKKKKKTDVYKNILIEIETNK